MQDDGYGYDAAANLISISDNRVPSAKVYTYSNGSTTVSVNTDHSATFTFDVLDRLNTWAPAGNSTSGMSTYVYDALDNITGEGGDAIAFTSCGTTSAPAHCITRFRGDGSFEDTGLGRFVVVPLSHGTLIPLPEDVVWSAVHDSEGKRTSLFLGTDGHTDSYSYDYKQLLSQVTRDGSSAARERYQYNYSGERTQKVFSQQGRSTTTWFIGPDFEVQQSSADPAGTYSATWYVGNAAVITAGNVIDGQATAATVLANEGKAMAGELDHGNPQGTYLRLEDRLGSSTVMTNPQGGRATGFVDGSEVSRYGYSPWGQLLAQDASKAYERTGYDTTPVKFTGQRNEEYSRLMFFEFRYYDPGTKRFIVANDAVNGGLTAQGLNRYAYVRNNPLRFIDPTGDQADDSGDRTEMPTITISTQVEIGPTEGASSDVFGIGELKCEVCEDPSFAQFSTPAGQATASSTGTTATNAVRLAGLGLLKEVGTDTGRSIFWAGKLGKEAAFQAVESGLASEALETTLLYRVPQPLVGPSWRFAKGLQDQGLKNFIARYVFRPMSAAYGFRAGISGREALTLIDPVKLELPAGRIFTSAERPAYNLGQKLIPAGRAFGYALVGASVLLQSTQNSPKVTGDNPDFTDLNAVEERLDAELDYFIGWTLRKLGISTQPLPPAPWQH